MRSARSRLGQKGEILAAEELGKQGYRIIESNYRTRYGEVDLIAYDGEYLVFVEVRSLSSSSFCRPIDTIGPKKISRILYAAQHYIEARNLGECAIRFDIVEVQYVQAGKPTITVVKDAFTP